MVIVLKTFCFVGLVLILLNWKKKDYLLKETFTIVSKITFIVMMLYLLTDSGLSEIPKQTMLLLLLTLFVSIYMLKYSFQLISKNDIKGE